MHALLLALCEPGQGRAACMQPRRLAGQASGPATLRGAGIMKLLFTAARQDIYWCQQASGDAALLEPGAVLGAPAGSLRACGLSERKAAYILDLAARFASGALSTARIATMDDDAMFAELSAIKGIGAPQLTSASWECPKYARAGLALTSLCKQQLTRAAD